MDTAGFDKTPVFYADAMRSYFVRSDFVRRPHRLHANGKAPEVHVLSIHAPVHRLVPSRAEPVGHRGPAQPDDPEPAAVVPAAAHVRVHGHRRPSRGYRRGRPHGRERRNRDFSGAGAMSIYNWSCSSTFRSSSPADCRRTSGSRRLSTGSTASSTRRTPMPSPHRSATGSPCPSSSRTTRPTAKQPRIEEILAEHQARALMRCGPGRTIPFKPDVPSRGSGPWPTRRPS